MDSPVMLADCSAIQMCIRPSKLTTLNVDRLVELIREIDYVTDTCYDMGAIWFNINLFKFGAAYGKPDMIRAIVFTQNRLRAISQKCLGVEE